MSTSPLGFVDKMETTRRYRHDIEGLLETIKVAESVYHSDPEYLKRLTRWFMRAIKQKEDYISRLNSPSYRP